MNALKNQAKANIVSSPSVLTLDNTPAVLNSNVTFYTKLEGKNVASLQEVSTGQLLRVTPHLIDTEREDGKHQILLTLSIEDGSPTSSLQTVDNLPQTQESQINTQAKLVEGQSLLIGGFIRNTESSEVRKIPLLGDIPYLGAFFRSTKHSTQNLVRLFLIQAQPVNI